MKRLVLTLAVLFSVSTTYAARFDFLCYEVKESDMQQLVETSSYEDLDVLSEIVSGQTRVIDAMLAAESDAQKASDLTILSLNCNVISGIIDQKLANQIVDITPRLEDL